MNARLILLIGATVSLFPPPGNAALCASAREFITAYEFFRDQDHFGRPETETRKLAEKIASSCEGAAGRFIEATRILLRAGLGSAQALKEATEISQAEPASAKAFFSIFKSLFARDGFDLSLQDALQAARSLSVEFKASSQEQEQILEDFQKLGQFCEVRSGLQLGKRACAEFAVRVARKGRGLNPKLPKAFREFYDFLRDSNAGPGLTVSSALQTAEQTLALGPQADENFIQAYRYASHPKGLALGVPDSLAFAQRLMREKP